MIRGTATRRIAGMLLAVILVGAACSEPADEGVDTEPASTTGEPDVSAATDSTPTEPSATEPVVSEPDVPSTDPQVDSDGSIVSGFAGQSWFLGELPSSANPADDSLEPILLGMINNEDTPLGSFPEVRAAAEAAATWINTELGGVDGRPVEIISCISSFDVEQSQQCALELQQAGVVAFVGGVDVTSNGSYPVIEQNDLAVVGGVPANLVEQRSPNAFFFSGGGAAGAAAMMSHAKENGAGRVVLAYGEFEAFEVAARDYAAAVGESLGLDVELVPFSLFATDYLPILTKASDVEAQAVIVLAADAACVPLMEIAADLGLDATLYLFGSCAAESILDAAGEAVTGVIFNSEGPVVEGEIEGEIFQAVIDRYATEPAGAIGTVGFRGMMNLYAILNELGGDNISSAGILQLARDAVDEPSFWGHPYTCDGQQVPGLPALCAPQQILFTIPAAGEDPMELTGWIPTDELFAVALG
jgi:branched-chain amino acid transport system substrate-binding protein